jgi:hypothetical protein
MDGIHVTTNANGIPHKRLAEVHGVNQIQNAAFNQK